MMTITVTLAWIIKISRWAFLFAFGLFLYRKYKLPSLPWIGAYLIASIINTAIMPFFISGLLTKAFTSPLFGENLYKILPTVKHDMPIYKTITIISNCSALFGAIEYLLITLIVISEVIFYISDNTDTEIPALLRSTLRIRKNIKLVGASVVTLTLVSPILTILASMSN